MKKKEIKKIKNNFSYWENVISQYWKINGKFLKLNSEFDLNIEVSSKVNFFIFIHLKVIYLFITYFSK